MRRIATAFSLAFALVSFAAPALAQTSPEGGGAAGDTGGGGGGAQPSEADLAEARAQFGAGVAAFRAHHFPDAVIAFERSLHLRPHPTTLYNAAEARFRAGDRTGAIQQLREMLAMTSPPPGQNDIDRARALAREAGIENLEPAAAQSVSCPVCPTCAPAHECPVCPPPQVVHEGSGGVPIVPMSLMVGGAVVLGIGMTFYGYALADAYVYNDPGSADVTRQLVRPQGEAFRWVGLVGLLGGVALEATGVVLTMQGSSHSQHAARTQPTFTAHLELAPGGLGVAGTF